MIIFFSKVFYILYISIKDFKRNASEVKQILKIYIKIKNILLREIFLPRSMITIHRLSQSIFFIHVECPGQLARISTNLH